MFVYLSHPWGPSCPSYGNGERIELKQVRCISHGDTANTLRISGLNHVGTHFDFPKHFDTSGKTVLDFPPEYFIHQHVAVVWLEKPLGSLVTVYDLKNQCDRFARDRVTLVLIRTGASLYRYDESFWKTGLGIDIGVAGFLRKTFPKLTTVGVDAISIASYVSRELGREVHKEFLCSEAPILLIEDMNLEELCGRHVAEVMAFPLRIEGGDGAPCTVVARAD